MFVKNDKAGCFSTKDVVLFVGGSMLLLALAVFCPGALDWNARVMAHVSEKPKPAAQIAWESGLSTRTTSRVLNRQVLRGQVEMEASWLGVCYRRSRPEAAKAAE